MKHPGRRKTVYSGPANDSEKARLRARRQIAGKSGDPVAVQARRKKRGRGALGATRKARDVGHKSLRAMAGAATRASRGSCHDEVCAMRTSNQTSCTRFG